MTPAAQYMKTSLTPFESHFIEDAKANEMPVEPIQASMNQTKCSG